MKKRRTFNQYAGAFELPYAASQMVQYGKGIDVVICLGCLIKGDTFHFEYISNAVSQGIMTLNVTQKIPVLFGVLTVSTEKQALERAGLQGGHNHGIEW